MGWENFSLGSLVGKKVYDKGKKRGKSQGRAEMDSLRKKNEALKLERKSLLSSDLVGQDINSQMAINNYLDRKTLIG